MKKISVILVNYNGKRYNEKCIETLLESKVEDNLDIWIVDNASSDGSIEVLQEIYCNRSDIHFVLLQENYGFSVANNEGIKVAIKLGCDYVMLLNNDTEVKQTTIKELLEVCQQKENCVVIPKIYYFDNPDKIWFAGGKNSKIIKKSTHIGLDEIDKGQYEQLRKVDFATGCCIFVSRITLEKLGLLDESYFLYYEDNEWSFRMKRLGISIFYQPKAVIYHKVNGTTNGNQNEQCAYYIARNWLMCSKKHLGYRFLIFFLYFILNRVAICSIWLLTGRKKLVKMTIKGIKDFFVGKTGKYRED